VSLQGKQPSVSLAKKKLLEVVIAYSCGWKRNKFSVFQPLAQLLRKRFDHGKRSLKMAKI